MNFLNNQIYMLTHQTELCNSFVKYFDVSTKIKNNIKKVCNAKNEITWNVYWEVLNLYLFIYLIILILQC